MKCPCENCLKYPICKYKLVVYCSDMVSYVRDSCRVDSWLVEYYVQFWGIVHEHLTCKELHLSEDLKKDRGVKQHEVSM
jgi:hypothetical protein